MISESGPIDFPLSPPTTRRNRLDADLWTQRVALGLLLVMMALFIIGPLVMILVRSVTDEKGAFVGLHNFVRYFSTPSLLGSLINTLIVGVLSMVGCVLLAFPYAYAITRSKAPLRKLFLVLSMVPLYAPTMLYGLGLIYLFGNQGLVTHGFFGRVPISVDIHLYGLTGIVIAEILATFPMVVLVLVVSLSHTDRRLYDAAASMGASTLRTFWSVTLPGCRLGLISAASIAFIFSTTDFGAPQVLGLKRGVLATDIFTQVVGLQDFSMGAAIAMVLLVPTVLASAIEILVRRRQAAMLSSRSVPMTPESRPLRDWLLFAYCLLIAAGILLVTLTPLFVSCVRNWPYSLSAPASVLDSATGKPASVFTLKHYDFASIGIGQGAYFNTIIVAIFTAVLGTAIAFLSAYLVEKTRLSSAVRSTARAIAMAPLGLPGLVLGLAFALLFSRSHWGPMPNPLTAMYGTLGMLIACNIVHFLGVSFLTASSALKQIDDEFEQVAASLAIPAWRLFFRVTVPICLPAILEIALYFFVSATTTISAVIFLYAAATPLASISVIHLDDTGWTQSAAAMSMLILLGNVVARTAAEPLIRLFRRKTQAWATT